MCSSKSDINGPRWYVDASSWRGFIRLSLRAHMQLLLILDCLKLHVWHVSSQSERWWSPWESLTIISQMWFSQCRSAIAGTGKLFL